MIKNKTVEIIDFDQIEVYLINGNLKLNESHYRDVHQKSFKCWQEVWSDYYINEQSNSDRLNSDEFTRQDDILSLFYKGDCFGITFFKEVDFDDITAPLDSYFEIWPKNALDDLVSRGKKISICSQFTVAKNFRGKSTNIQWKTILFGFIMKRFLESNVDAMTGTMRVMKKMEKMSYEAGAFPLLKNLNYKNRKDEYVDLVAFFKKEVSSVYTKNPYSKSFDKCWDRLNGIDLARLKLVK